MITIKELIGEWELNDFIITQPTGTTNTWGRNPTGILIYTINGYMSVSINSNIENLQQSRNRFKHILFYAGRYKIVSSNKVVHYVKNASDINKIGKKLSRDIVFENSTLKLIGKGDFGTSILTWKKLTPFASLDTKKYV